MNYHTITGNYAIMYIQIANQITSGCFNVYLHKNNDFAYLIVIIIFVLFEFNSCFVVRKNIYGSKSLID